MISWKWTLRTIGARSSLGTPTMKDRHHTGRWMTAMAVMAGLGLAVIWGRRAARRPVGVDPPVVRAWWTTAEERAAEEARLVEAIAKAVAVPPAVEHADVWRAGLQAMGLLRSVSPDARERLAQALVLDPPLPDDLLRAFLEVTVALYAGDLEDEVGHVARWTSSEKLHAMAVHHLTHGRPERAEEWRLLMLERFPEAPHHPILRVLLWQLEVGDLGIWMAGRPDLATLLKDTAPGNAVIFSLQRRSRDWVGRAIVRRPDGGWIRRADGRVLSIPQLARSMSGLPGVITHGNTPQGIHRWKGYAVSASRLIGPTPNLQLSLPFESPARPFLVDLPVNSAEEAYAALLPEPWRAWPPMWEAFWAGLAGRTEIIAHGTTIAVDWQTGHPWFPISPSLGCLTAAEEWSPQDGGRTTSGQAILVAALQDHGIHDGYVCVVDIDDRQQAVSAEEVGKLIDGTGARATRFTLGAENHE